MYKIGELSALCRIPVKTLRFYDSEGILTPVYIDNFTGYRYYSAAQLSDCYKIVKLKEERRLSVRRRSSILVCI